MSTSYFSPDTDPWLYQCRGHVGHVCGAATEPSPALLEALNHVRRLYGAPLVINSGPRCAQHNAREGGAFDSEHLTHPGCDGADVACEGSRMRYMLTQAAFNAGVGRIGIGNAFVHIGVSPRLDPHVLWLYGAAKARVPG